MRRLLAPRTFPLDLIALVALVGAVMTVYAGIRHFYFGGAFLDALSYVNDERPMNAIISGLLGVDPAQTLVGVHSFGDYFQPHYWMTLDAPWQTDGTNMINYLPTVLVVHKALALLPYKVGLFAFEAAMAAALMAPAFYALKGRRWSLRVLAAVLLGLLSGPAIASLDRGNTQGFVPILLFAVAVAVMRERWGWATVFLVAAASIKIYPLVLVLVLLALRKWKWAGISIGATVGLALVTLPLVSRNLWPTAQLVFTNVLKFDDRDFTSFMSYNVSLAGGLAHGAFAVGLQGVAEWIAGHGIIVGLVYLAAVAPLIWVTRLELWVRIIVAMLLTTAVMPLVYPYAVNWVVAACALALFMSVGSRGADGRERPVLPRSQAIPVLVGVAALTAVYPVFLPGSMEAAIPVSVLAIVSAVVSLALPASLWWAASRKVTA